MTIVRELLTVFGVKYDDHGAKKAEESIRGLIKGARVLVAAVAASAVVVGIKQMVEEQVEFAQQLERTSKRLGIQTDSLQELRYAAEQAGIEGQALDTALQKFTIRTAEAAKGTGSAVNTLKELGVQLTDSTGKLKAPGVLLAEAADGFAKMSSQADRARIAQTLFEEEGIKLIDMLQGGSAGLKKMRQEAHQLGAVMGGESINSTHKLWVVLKHISLAFTSIKRSLMDALMPALQIAAEGFESFITGLNKMIKNTSILKSILIVLGVVAGFLAVKMVIAFAPVILTFVAIAAAVAAVVLVVDELYNLFTGGDSLTGRFFGGIKQKFQDMKTEAGNFSWSPSQGLFRVHPQISNHSSLIQKSSQNTKIDVHVKTNANPVEISREVARMIDVHHDRVNRNTYQALVHP